MKKWILFSILFLSACATTDFLYIESSGSSVYEADCGTLGYCYQKANQQCPNGFEVIDRIANENVHFYSISLVYRCK